VSRAGLGWFAVLGAVSIDAVREGRPLRVLVKPLRLCWSGGRDVEVKVADSRDAMEGLAELAF
jgi:hypothetical protein